MKKIIYTLILGFGIIGLNSCGETPEERARDREEIGNDIQEGAIEIKNDVKEGINKIGDKIDSNYHKHDKNH